jgi:hypothetical protein
MMHQERSALRKNLMEIKGPMSTRDNIYYYKLRDDI